MKRFSERRRKCARDFPERGFALVVVLSLMVLLTLTAVGLLSLSAVSLRMNGEVLHQARAKANARLALMMALGQLQELAGPDTRVTATASILGEKGGKHPHWTGIWNSRAKDGGPMLVRNDAEGGLKDTRGEDTDKVAARALGWLVSGGGFYKAVAPDFSDDAALVRLVGPGSAGDAVEAQVRAPKVPVADGGHLAWWTGDAGVKANVATPDAFAGREPAEGDPAGGGWFRLMVSQEADTAALTGTKYMDETLRKKLVSQATLGFAVSPEAVRNGFHDFTTDSLGVLSDTARGGLKRDLTAYFQSGGHINDRDGMPGIDDSDNLVGPANAAAAERDGLSWDGTRHRFTSPRFGLLRRWATLDVPFSEATVGPRPPKTEPEPRVSASDSMALCNLAPATIAANDTPNLSPVLVEGSLMFGISRYRKPAGSEFPYDIRSHIYPRVVLWNPYNVKLTMGAAMAMIQGNGRQEMWTTGPHPTFPAWTYTSQWIWFEGGRSTNFNEVNGSILNSEGYVDPYIGSFYFALPETTFDPGECLVFSPEQLAEYSAPVYAQNGPYNLAANKLTCKLPPHPSRSFTQTNTNIRGGMPYPPKEFWFDAVTYWANGGIRNQADDCRVVLKQLNSGNRVTFEMFDALPQLAVLNASLQFGAGREPRIKWNRLNRVPIEETTLADARVRNPPDVRTREGVRLRWFDETASNLLASGGLKNTAHFEDAPLAVWNPRAAYATRSPYDNIGGSLPVSGSLGGPWFFGIYTRDLFDNAVSFQEQAPVPRNGRYHGNPFGPPQENGGRPIVLFDVPRAGTGVLSLGQFQHAKLSEFVWHPSYAVGNSLADPRIATGHSKGLDHTSPVYATPAQTARGGFDSSAIGWSGDTERGGSKDSWAAQARAIYQDYPGTDDLVCDLSFELNQTLWDSYFISSGSREEKRLFASGGGSHPLPNGRMRLAPGSSATGKTEDDLTDFHRAARALCVDGAFNVNSTSVAAWRALLGSTRALSADGKSAAFPRILAPPGGPWTTGDSTDSDAAWTGRRDLSEDELDRLAKAIVEEVKLRGPFLSLADFVNRRLANDATGRMGALQAAIRRAGLNEPFQAAFPLDNAKPLPDYLHPDNIADATRLEQTVKPDCKAWGIPGYLTQADVLQVLGPVLSARSDTFLIRTYGDSTDSAGVVRSRAWCEAVVQRVPQPVEPGESGINPKKSAKGDGFGRRFLVKSVRWLRPEEV